MSKTLLQAVSIVLCIVPIYFGTIGLVQGAARFMPEAAVTANADSQIRNMFGWYFALPALLIYMIPRIEHVGAVFRITACTIAFGGLMRLVSMWDVGLPDTQRFIVLALEFAVLALIPWQAAIARQGQASP